MYLIARRQQPDNDRACSEMYHHTRRQALATGPKLSLGIHQKRSAMQYHRATRNMAQIPRAHKQRHKRVEQGDKQQAQKTFTVTQLSSLKT